MITPIGRNISAKADHCAQPRKGLSEADRCFPASPSQLDRKLIAENPAGKPGKPYRQAKKVREKIDPLNHEEAFLGGRATLRRPSKPYDFREG
jgi:hypothetical protein